MRRAAGDVVGKTVAAQVRQAARHLGYPADDWRVREAWYGRAGAWSAAAVDDLRRRFAAWREREACAPAPSTLAQRVGAVRRLLTELEQQVAGLEAEVDRMLVDGCQPNGGGSASDA